ncbi:mitochondrial carrier domain-containing protein [Mycena vulgaris]|nr:mitochondrial carrier domain-containing protein [Mycena vulgaris]
MGSLATVNELLAGSVGGAAQVLVGKPLDTVKTRAQIPSSSKGLMDIIMQTVRKEGFFALYKGISGVKSLPFAIGLSGSMADAANAILASSGVKTDKHLRRTKRQFGAKYGDQLPVCALLASGSTDGIAYWLACYPLDVIKSHIQLRGTPPTGTPVQYIGHEVKLKLIVAESGFVGLFCGLSPSCTIPTAASTFAALSSRETPEWII